MRPQNCLVEQLKFEFLSTDYWSVMSGTLVLSFMVKNANLGKVYFVKISDLCIRNTLEYIVCIIFT